MGTLAAAPLFSHAPVATADGELWVARMHELGSDGFWLGAPPSVRTAQAVDEAPVVRHRSSVRTVVRAPRRDWKKTALVVGGSTATAAGLGGLIGGKKGALVGAALGGGLSTLYETTRDR